MKAFPNPTLSDTENSTIDMLTDDSQYGMDLRDYFAGLAMQGLLSNPNYGNEITIYETVKTCYAIADTMMREKEDE